MQVLLKDEVPATLERIADRYPELEPGGRFKPSNCTARHRVAVIVPYRAREDHLRAFVLNIHPFLKKQLVDYLQKYGTEKRQRKKSKQKWHFISVPSSFHSPLFYY